MTIPFWDYSLRAMVNTLQYGLSLLPHVSSCLCQVHTLYLKLADVNILCLGGWTEHFVSNVGTPTNALLTSGCSLLTPPPTHAAATRANSLGQSYTRAAVRRAEPSMSCFFNSSFLPVDGIYMSYIVLKLKKSISGIVHRHFDCIDF
jgi:hypothetical protein